MTAERCPLCGGAPHMMRRTPYHGQTCLLCHVVNYPDYKPTADEVLFLERLKAEHDEPCSRPA